MKARRCAIAAGAALLFVSTFATAEPLLRARGQASALLAAPAPVTSLQESVGTPLVPASVSVANAAASGQWSYFALADITTPKMQVFGSLTNTGATPLGDGEVSLLSASATLRDTLTIAAPSADPYLVTVDMVIDGVLQGVGSNARVNALLTVTPTGSLSVFDSTAYTGDVTVVDDVLSVTRQFSGNAEFDLSSELFFAVSRVNPGVSVIGDFSHTAIIRLSITTLGGDPIENPVVTSQSGSFGVAPVPLPATLPLMLGGLVGLALRMRR